MRWSCHSYVNYRKSPSARVIGISVFPLDIGQKSGKIVDPEEKGFEYKCSLMILTFYSMNCINLNFYPISQEYISIFSVFLITYISSIGSNESQRLSV